MVKFYGFLVCTCFIFMYSCQQKEDELKTFNTSATEEDIYTFILSNPSKYYYKNTTTLLNQSSGSGHNYPFFRTWYNSLAHLSLNEQGTVNTDFQDGALLVKELYNENKELQFYVIMYKLHNHQFADAQGWTWAYIKPNGSPYYALNQKGKDCISCHQQEQHIDYTLMSKYFP